MEFKDKKLYKREEIIKKVTESFISQSHNFAESLKTNDLKEEFLCNASLVLYEVINELFQPDCVAEYHINEYKEYKQKDLEYKQQKFKGIVDSIFNNKIDEYIH